MDCAHCAFIILVFLSMHFKTSEQKDPGVCEADDFECQNWPESKLICDRQDEKCVCQYSFETWNDGRKACEGKLYQEPCTVDAFTDTLERDIHNKFALKCVNGFCACADGKELIDNVTKTCYARSKYGEECAHDYQCEHQGVLKCVDSVCVCPNKSQDLFNSACQTRDMKAWGASCNKPGDQCNTERNLICSSGGMNAACICKPGFSWNNVTKLCRSDPTIKSCPDGEEYSQESMSCKLKGGESCLEDGVLRHDLCASGVCHGEDTMQEGLTNRCGCVNDGGIKQYWSPNGRPRGCLPEYNDRPCSRSDGNDACGPSGITNGLVCLEKNGGWLCACEKTNHVYYNRICVEANRSYGQTCVGSEGTCKVDLSGSLVCRDQTCKCLPMRMNSTDGKVIFTKLDWDATAQKCVLKMKENGAACRSSAECAGGQCNLSKCVPSRAGVQIHGTKFVVIMAIFIALQ